MARMEYFGTFPTTEYDIGKDNKTRTVTNIMKRVGIRGDFTKFLPTYYKRVLSIDQRPEIAADHIYGEAKHHWILMHMNKTVAPYYDFENGTIGGISEADMRKNHDDLFKYGTHPSPEQLGFSRFAPGEPEMPSLFGLNPQGAD